MKNTVKTIILENGKTHILKRLSISDIMMVSDAIHSLKEKLVEKYSKDAGLDKFEKSNAMLDLSFRKPTISEIANSCDIPEVLLLVIKTACKGITAAEQDEIIDSMSLGELPMLAKALILDVNLDEKKEKEAPKESPFVAVPLTGQESEKSEKTEVCFGKE